VNGTPTFSWATVLGAASYKLEVSLYNTFSPLYDSVTTNNTSFTPTKAYESPNTYYWRVAMIDRDGKAGPFNNATILSGTEPGGSGGSGDIYIPLVNMIFRP
jgi:hypothetical protein